MPIITATGQLFNYDKIDENSINIKDISIALSNINRFIGHTSRPYSVAEHTVRGFMLAMLSPNYSSTEALHYLMHDFTEAYVGDCPTPLKKMMPQFGELEDEINKAIYRRFDIPLPTEEEHEKVKKIDALMLAIEMHELTKHNYEDFIEDREEFNQAVAMFNCMAVQPPSFYAEFIEQYFKDMCKHIEWVDEMLKNIPSTTDKKFITNAF
ncbi:MAG: HD domain-containing protein [Gammaproteobacteria bacterium]